MTSVRKRLVAGVMTSVANRSVTRMMTSFGKLVSDEDGEECLQTG